MVASDLDQDPIEENKKQVNSPVRQFPKKKKNGDKKGGQPRRQQYNNKKQDELINVAPELRKRVSFVHKSEKRTEKALALTKETYLLHTEETGLIRPETELENTFQVKQKDIQQQADLSTKSKSVFELNLKESNLSPYTKATYSRNGKSLLLSSRKGHLSIINWKKQTLQCETYLNETIRDCTFLHNDLFFATAQKDFVYIYDSAGSQIHTLKKNREPGRVLNLPHHLLLASISAPTMPHANLIYTDTSTGDILSTVNYSGRSLGLSNALSASVNLSNGIIHIAHNSGVVSLWSPNVERPLARIFCHSGGVKHVSIMANGTDMVTTGLDGFVKITDLKTYKTKCTWKLPHLPTSLTCSQKDIIALSFGATVQTWIDPSNPLSKEARLKDQKFGNAPYMSETFSGKRITGLEFCPYEDILSVCHEDGLLSMIIPGSGEPTFDSSAPNPYETKKQRREGEIRMLLDKLPASSIALDASLVGSVDQDPAERLKEIHNREKQANIEKLRKKSTKKKTRGRSKISKRVHRRQSNVIDAKRLEMEDQMEEERKTKALARQIAKGDKQAVEAGTEAGEIAEAHLPSALNRFFSK